MLTRTNLRSAASSAIAAALLAGLAMTGSAHAEGCTPGQLADQFPAFKGKTIRVAADPNEPPMMFRDAADPNTLTGFHADLVRDVAACLGANVEFDVYEFSGLIPSVTSGRTDVQFTGMYYKPERAKVVDYVNYLRGITGALVAKGQGERFKTLDGACGARGAVLTGAVDEVILREQSAKCVAAGKAPIEISSYPNTAATVREVQNHRADLCMVEAAVVAEQVREQPDVFDKGYTVSSNLKIGASVAKTSTALRDAILGSLQFLQKSGETERLIVKYSLDPSMVIPPEVKQD